MPVLRVLAAKDENGRWRCRSTEAAEDTEAVGEEPESRRGRARQTLSVAVLDPAVALPLPLVELDGMPPELGGRGSMTMLERLGQGQTIGLAEAEWRQLTSLDELAELSEDPRQLCLRARDDEGRSAIIVVANATRESSEVDGTSRVRVRPERVVRAVSRPSSQRRSRPKKPHRQA